MKSITRIIRTNLNYYYSLFIIVSSSAYLSNITSFSPIYFLLIFSIFISLFIFSNNDVFYLDNDQKLLKYIILFIGIYRIISFVIFPINLKENLLQFLSCFYFILILKMNKKISIDFFIKVIFLYFMISDLFLLFDFIFRFFRRTDSYKGLLFFYNFKLGGIMFMDSNFSAFLGMINLSGKLYFKYKKIDIKFHFLSTFILTILNLSRASFVGIFFAYIVYNLFSSRKTIRIYKLCIFSVFIVLASIFLLSIKDFDDSFLTKFSIFNATFNSIDDSSIFHFLFGNGIGSSKEILNVGFSAHNYFSRCIIEIGFLGFLLYFNFYLLLLFSTKGAFLFILLPYLTAGLSMCPSNCPYFFMLAGCIYLYEHKNIYFKVGNNV